MFLGLVFQFCNNKKHMSYDRTLISDMQNKIKSKLMQKHALQNKS